MKIGIIFAMEEEINETLKYADVINEYEMFGIKFYEVLIDSKNCILGLCGVGKVNASRCTQIMIDNMNVDFIINVGVAGGLSNNLKVLDSSITFKYNIVRKEIQLCTKYIFTEIRMARSR